jgi:hypothetical protein
LTDVFIKRFDDRYTQSREYQFLDLLNQLQAPVPAVFSNDTQLGQIQMAHAGVTLHEWLLSLPATAGAQSQALNALQQALSISRRIAKLEVWHFDLAFRNFMVEQANTVSAPIVRLIDFSLAVSPRFPVQKPLWMRPDTAQQHLALHAAVTEDWRQFFRRNQLPEPLRYDEAFDIPMTTYRADWSNDLAVDRITQRWCVITHSLGMMLIQSTQFACFSAETRLHIDSHGRGLMHLTSESQAELALEETLQWLSSQFSTLTPRPRAQVAQVTQVAEAPAIQTLSTKPTGLIASALTEPITIQSAPLPALVVATLNVDASTIPAPPKAGLSGFRLLLSGVLIGLAYVLMDAIYTAHHVRVTPYTVTVLLATLALSAVLLVSLIFSAHRTRLVSRLSQTQGLALLALSLEIWTQRVPDPWPLVMAALGLILLALTLEARQKPRAV